MYPTASVMRAIITGRISDVGNSGTDGVELTAGAGVEVEVDWGSWLDDDAVGFDVGLLGEDDEAVGVGEGKGVGVVEGVGSGDWVTLFTSSAYV